MPLLREATWVVCLADFSDLPPDLRTLILQQMGDILSQRRRDRLAATRMQRVWQELDLDVAKAVTHIIE